MHGKFTTSYAILCPSRSRSLAIRRVCDFTAKLALALVLASNVAVAKKESKEADLQQIKSRIEAVRKNIQADTGKRDALLDELRTADLNIQSAREQSSEIRKQRQASEQKLADLQREHAQTEHIIATRREALAGELRAAYMNGREEPLKLLLNQQDPAQFGRMLIYYSYFGSARANQIAEIRDHLSHLELIAESVTQETQRLREIELQQQSQVTQLAQARKQRAQTLVSIQSKLRSHGDELANLQREAATLERLLEELRRAAQDFPSLGKQPFTNVEGKLPWPVNGKIVAHFGQLRAGGPMKWQGVLIRTAPGAQIRAPFYGRVVYADWLAGMGLLVVLDHGGGYLSLYGHNEQVYRKIGDVVMPGDPLGVAADKGDGEAEVYLEIRKGKQPLDPMKWLKKP